MKVVQGSSYIRIIGTLPDPALASYLTSKGAFSRAGEWWVPRSVWEGVRRVVEAAEANAAAAPVKVPPPAQSRSCTVSAPPGEGLRVTGDLPRTLPPEWMGRITAKGYEGLSPWMAKPAIQAIEADGIKVTLDAGAASRVTLFGQRRAACDAASSPLWQPPDIALSPPSTCEHEVHAMRPYQARAVGFWEGSGRRCVLAADVGTGKKVMGIGAKRRLDDMLGRPARVIVITRPIDKFNWVEHAAEFDGRGATVLSGTDPDSGALRGVKDWVIGNYEILRPTKGKKHSSPGWGPTLADWRPDFLILDESHWIKGGGKGKKASTAQGEAARRLAAATPYLLETTGTPMEKVLDLWPQIDAAQPGCWGSRFTYGIAFAGLHKGRWGWQPSEHPPRADLLHDLLKGVMLSLPKELVAPDLPPVTRVKHIVALEPEWTAKYQELEARYVQWLNTTREAIKAGKKPADLEGSVLDWYTKRCMMSSRARACNTADYLEMLLTEHEEPSVAFFVYLEALDIVAALLKERGLRVGVIKGGMSAKAKWEASQAFQRGETDIILVQVNAGGEAINLFRASVTFHHDVSFSMGTNEQCEGRTDRIGQTRPTTHYYAQAKGTVDEEVVDIVVKKLAAKRSILYTGEVIDQALVNRTKQTFFGGA